MNYFFENTYNKEESSNVISVRRTGIKIKRMLYAAGYGVTDVQRALGLACPQSIYRWFAGTSLPTVDHLFIISRMLGVRVDDLLVQECRVESEKAPGYKYMVAYYDRAFSGF